MYNLNYHCKWRIELAKQLCEKLKGMEGIKAIVIGGSVARGYADEYSDLEIPIFWDEQPDENTRKQIIKELNAEYFYPYDFEAREDNVIIDGFRVDLWHVTIEEEEYAIKAVTENFEIDFGCSNAMDTIRTCISLYGDEIVRSWKNRAKEYPEQVAIKIIEKSLQSIDSSQVELYLQRKNPTLLYEQIVNMQKNIFLILLAINKKYFPTFKWMYKSLETLKIKPESIEDRFREIFTCPPREAFTNTIILMQETINIIKTFYPEIITEELLNRLRTTRVPQVQPINI